MALPAGPPEVVWRAGLDLNPLDVTNPVDLAWLDALIWPEHAHRRARLRAAAALAAAEPALLVQGRPGRTTCPRWLRRHLPRRPW